MSETRESYEVHYYEPSEFFLLIAILTVFATILYVMCMCMHRFQKISDGEISNGEKSEINFCKILKEKFFRAKFSE